MDVFVRHLIFMLLASCLPVYSGPPPGCMKIDCSDIFEGMGPLDPEADDDGDGIPNERDGAPTLPEDKDGVQDDDGIPDPDPVQKDEPKKTTSKNPPLSNKVSDLDNDGYADAYDVCLREPEDRDGFEDDDGCPELDNDGDGTPDKDDPCPNIPGTWCTAEKPKVVAAATTPDSLDVSEPFVFSDGTAKLDLVKSKEALRSLTQQLKAKPKLRVEIFGYANEKGTDEGNLSLSQKRAEALRAFLLKMKIAKERMVATGRGADGERRIDLAVIP